MILNILKTHFEHIQIRVHESNSRGPKRGFIMPERCFILFVNRVHCPKLKYFYILHCICNGPDLITGNRMLYLHLPHLFIVLLKHKLINISIDFFGML